MTSPARWRWSATTSSCLISTTARAASATNGVTSGPDDLDAQSRSRAPGPSARAAPDAMIVADSVAILDFLTKGDPVRPGGVGSIGYCMGGRHVMCVAGAYPQRFVAGASLHGTPLVSDADDSSPRLCPPVPRKALLRLSREGPESRAATGQHSVRRLPSVLVDYCMGGGDEIGLRTADTTTGL
jgi:hypothetical protein